MNLLRILSDQKEEILNLDIRNLISRPEEKELDLNSKFAQVVIGVRRCGKSTLCQKVLLENNVKFGYVNFDDERLINLSSAELDDIVSCLYRINGDFKILFLDEIQNVRYWQLFVNRMLRQGMHLLVTGSNANLLSSDLITHLTGRYNKIELLPFSFHEVCVAQKIDIRNFTTKGEALKIRALENYLFQGGFPEIIDGNAPPRYAFNLLSTIVKKDVVQRYRVKYPSALWKLSNVLIENPGRFVKPVSLAEKLGVKSYHTIEKYVDYLDNAYLLFKIKKFSYKAIDRKLTAKSYAIDPAFITQHDDCYQTESLGWRLENVVALELIRKLKWKGEGELYYAQKGKDFDVDFLICVKGHVKEIIQVCYDFKTPNVKLYNREVGNLFKAAKHYDCKKLTLIVMDGEPKEITKDGNTVKIIKAIDWFLNP